MFVTQLGHWATGTVCSSYQIWGSSLTKAPFSQSRNALLAYSSLSVTHMSTKRPEQLSQSTHTHAYCPQYGVTERQTVPSYRHTSNRQNWELGLSSELLSASLPKRQQSHLWRSRANIHDHQHTHTSRRTLRTGQPALEPLQRFDLIIHQLPDASKYPTLLPSVNKKNHTEHYNFF